ncbi:hypothetical protein CAL7716_102560 (plasmid) [Calothrix sp. PCC 7716]|nr:hypothetical protein CAL7716_102560 [Calothrix sp. PCC 7716]
MDNPIDFQFLDEEFATAFNKVYLIIRTHPVTATLYVAGTTNYKEKAISILESSNLGSDAYVFSLRIMQFGKLWNEDSSISQQQDWQIHQEYRKASIDMTVDGEIIPCDCSYPLFSALGTCLNTENEAIEYWYYVTCLEEDNGRQVETCPNCGKTLHDENDEDNEDDEEKSQPIACVGCKNYHGESYNGVDLICAIHPSGYNISSNCPDWR